MKDAILKELNPEQYEAVTTFGGPMLIVAGAGTGKTKVITHRIAHLVRSFPGLSPSNFLALAFSKKAAEEMLSRVEALIGEHKDELWILTFHSFCHRILKDRAADAGLSRNFRLLDRTEQWMVLKNILPDLDLKYYLNLADPFSPIGDFVKFISKCKNELVAPKEYAGYANSIKDKEEKPRHKEMAAVYAAYEKSMRASNCLDFEDLISLTIELFRKRPSVLRGYQEQFHYILVDEFQDTNIAQIELLSLLTEKRKNICVVGDDDQAIYRFRGASYASFLKFREKFPDLKTIKLTRNYRSTKKILAVSESLIANNNPDRYDTQKNLWTGGREGPGVDVIVAGDYAGEAQAVLENIKKIYEKEKDYSKIAVLYRAHSHNQELLKRLKLEGIPHNVAGPVGMFQRDEIKDLIALLSVINDPGDNVSLFRVLSLPGFDIDLGDVVTLNRLAKEKESPLYDMLHDDRVKKLVGGRTLAGLNEFKKALRHFFSLSNKVDVEKLFYEVIDKTGYVKDLVANLNRDNELKLSNIGKFYRIINAYTQEHADIMPAAFMEYLYAYIEAGGDIAEEADSAGAGGGVQLMTVHQAKGLEFPYVFVIGLVQNRFPTRMRTDAIPFPVGLIKEELPKGNFHLQEERRLFYVAITRAKEKLFVSTVNKPYHKSSVFLSEMLNENTRKSVTHRRIELEDEAVKYAAMFGMSKRDRAVIKGKKRIIDSVGKMAAAEILSDDAADKYFDDIKKDYYGLVRALREAGDEEATGAAVALDKTSMPLPAGLTLSYTSLDTFMNCPLKYKFRYIYGIPARPAAALRFGSDIHDTLEEFYRRVKEGSVPSLEELYKIYLSRWSSLGYVNKTQEMQYQRSGYDMLKRFYETNKEYFIPPLYIEEEFLITIGACKFRGFIDRIDELPDGGVELIDYKTGTPKNKAFVEKSVQLDLYAIACREVLRLEPKVLSFYFLTSNEKISTVVQPENLERTKDGIASTVEQIKSQEFQPKPGRRCRWCDYRIICPAARL